MPKEPQRSIMGEIVALKPGGAEIRLATGETGWLPIPSETDTQQPMSVGGCGSFVVGGTDAHGRLLLTAASAQDPEASHAFDREVDRLNNVLANHHPAPRRTFDPRPENPVGEERVEDWVDRVGQTIARLRKRRAKRLNEQL